jgi:uncharacterized protein YndB with AHSA1/START domain
MNRSPANALLGLALAGLGATCAAERTIDKEVVVNATVDQDWDAWTTREGIRSFFAADAVVEPRVGGAFHIQTDPGDASDMKEADDMRYMALQPK